MEGLDVVIPVLLILGGVYLFLRNVFGLSHNATILNIIIGIITGYFALSRDNRKEKRD